MTQIAMERPQSPAIAFAPRRLAHANLFVRELDRSIGFYNRVVGLEEVRREPGIGAGFLSNGNTHHDVGLIQIAREALAGIGGHVQIPEGRGKEPGLNHFGWEMSNEALLVAAYKRTVAAGLPVHRRADHQISHSIYVFDPDGNLNEFYADATHDWRSIFNLSRDDLVTSEWQVDDVSQPDPEPKYDPDPEYRRVFEAVFHPLKITHAVLVARNFPRMVDFYISVAGLARTADGDGAAFMSGTARGLDLVILPKSEGRAPGLHHFAFELPKEDDFAGARERLAAVSVEVELEVDNEAKRSVFVRDPDGIRLELYCRRGGTAAPRHEPGHLVPYFV